MLPTDQRAAHGIADSIEPRLARAFVRSIEAQRAGIDVNALAAAIHAAQVSRSRDAKAPLRAIGNLKDALSPAATIVKETVLRGGRLGADQVNNVLRRKA